MEIMSRRQDKPNPSHMNSQINYGSSSSNNNGGYSSLHQAPTPPLTPKTISRSETNPHPTTFVQADTSTFKQVVQMLTGSPETVKQASSKTTSDPPQSNKGCIPIIRSAPKKQSFKLYERRGSLKNGLMINTLVPGYAQNCGVLPRKPEILSPSILDFPSLALSPVTPLTTEDPFFNKSSSPSMERSSEEEKAIAEKKFYLHPSPRTTPRATEPQLLPLFPVTSPKFPGSSSSSA